MFDSEIWSNLRIKRISCPSRSFIWVSNMPLSCFVAVFILYFSGESTRWTVKVGNLMKTCHQSKIPCILNIFEFLSGNVHQKVIKYIIYHDCWKEITRTSTPLRAVVKDLDSVVTTSVLDADVLNFWGCEYRWSRLLPAGKKSWRCSSSTTTEPDSSQNYIKISFSSSGAPPPADQSV